MTEQKVYIGTMGPYLYDDADPIDDADGDFSGLNYSGITVTQMQAESTPDEPKQVLRLEDLYTIVRRYSTLGSPSAGMTLGNTDNKFRYCFMLGG